MSVPQPERRTKATYYEVMQVLILRAARAIRGWNEIERAQSIGGRVLDLLAGVPPRRDYKAVCVRCGLLLRSAGALQSHTHLGNAGARCTLGLGQPNIGLCVALGCRSLDRGARCE